MANRDRTGNGRSSIDKYGEYNGFRELNRDSYVGLEDDDVGAEEIFEDGIEEYYDPDEYYDEADEGEYYEEDDYYEEDGYYDGDEYYEEDDYYEDEGYDGGRDSVRSKTRRRRPVGKNSGNKGSRRTGRQTRSKARSKTNSKSKSRSNSRGGSQEERPKKKRRIFLFFIELLIFAALMIALFVILKWDKVNKTTLTESQIFINEEVKAALDTTTQDSGGSDEWGMKNYKNVALFGVDAGGTRSDTIIIASINTKTNEVKMCSIYRDTYLNIDSMENPYYTKANAAYAKGGPEQAIRMINMNTDMNVDDFITVDFDALEAIIDDLGGVEINVQPEEVDYINDYQFSIVMDLGGPKEGKITNPRNFTAVTTSGLQTLNGLQATAYCRIRYTAGSDFRRTERQREVISQIVQKAKGASLSQLNKVLDDVLPQITTSFTAAEFAAYASKVGSYAISETKGFPFENVTGKIGKQSMVVPDTLLTNVEEMHTFLFGESLYTPTTNVQTISEKVQADRVASGL